MSSPLLIRPLRTPAEYDACVELQRATWGDDFRELVPPALLQVTQKVGGVTAGAFEGDRLVGFVYGITGVRDGRPVHWSHMLVVEESRRDRGIGRRLKQHQRKWLARAGVDRMYWTFDPLVARNAHLNLDVLRARVVEYARDLYGENPMSRTDSVIGSDRFVVAWDLRPAPTRPSGRGRTTAGGAGPRRARAAAGARPLVSSDSDPLPSEPSVLIAIPSDIQAVKRTDRDATLAWRRSTRRAFEHYLSRRYAVAGLVPHPSGDGSCYLLERPA